jgi:hypothetical protein
LSAAPTSYISIIIKVIKNSFQEFRYIIVVAVVIYSMDVGSHLTIPKIETIIPLLSLSLANFEDWTLMKYYSVNDKYKTRHWYQLVISL